MPAYATKDVPPEKLADYIKRLKASGATAAFADEQPDGKYTVTSTYPDTQPEEHPEE